MIVAQLFGPLCDLVLLSLLLLLLLQEVEGQLALRASSCPLFDAATAAWAAVTLQLHRGSPRLLQELLQQIQLLQQQGAFTSE